MCRCFVPLNISGGQDICGTCWRKDSEHDTEFTRGRKGRSSWSRGWKIREGCPRTKSKVRRQMGRGSRVERKRHKPEPLRRRASAVRHATRKFHHPPSVIHHPLCLTLPRLRRSK